MPDPLGLIVLTAAGLSGALAARSAHPLSLGWPGAGEHLLVRRISMLSRPAPGRTARILGLCGLTLTISGAALAAYAAQPAAPDRLPGEVVGVVGSGDQLTLDLKTPTGPATLKVGDDYADGWRLKSLTNSEAVLQKDQEVRRVGLNPAGTPVPAPGPDGPPSVVQIAGLPDAATIARLYAQHLASSGDPDVPEAGLTRDETMRSVAYMQMIDNAIMDRRAAASARLGLPQDDIKVLEAAGVNKADEQAILGDAAYADQKALLDKWAAASGIDFSAPLGPGLPRGVAGP